jgi:3-phosphoshikimate 1-carboxyvinyltransferase
MPDKPNSPIPLAASRSPWLRGTVRVPGDRTASRLALVLAALSRGESVLEHLAGGPDMAGLAAALRALGPTITQRGDTWTVQGLGLGCLLAPEGPIDVAPLGDAVLLLIAVLGVQSFEATLSGYAPTAMSEALLDFLHRTGTHVERSDAAVTLRGPRFALPLDLRLPHEALALKTPLLLAALTTAGTSILRLPEEADPAEDLCTSFGAAITASPDEEGPRLMVEGRTPLKGTRLAVASDPILAAFPTVAALIAPDSEIAIESVSLSVARMAVLDALKLMGADIAMPPAKAGGRDTADLLARHGKLIGTVIPADLGIEAEDFPILAVAAAFAEGETLFEGLAEGGKRLNLTRALRANGVECEEREVGLAVRGARRAPGGGTVNTRLDPKLAMAFLVLGMAADKPVSIDDGAVMADVFPDFVRGFEHVGCRFTAGKT